MKTFMRMDLVSFKTGRWPAALRALAALMTPWVFVACGAIGASVQAPGSDPIDPSRGTPKNFAAELKANQEALRRGQIARDRGLFQIGAILAHPSNPHRNPTRAIQSFKTLITEHPRSAMIDQSRLWIEVLEQEQKIADERQKLAEEKRALSKERELLAQERQKLEFANERSRQLDLDIEKRRRRLLSK
jgi:hypothetical protein